MLKRIKDFYLVYFSRRISEDDCLRLIIDKELKPYKVDMQFVLDNPEIEGEPWYIHYKFNNENEFIKWKKFSLKMIKKAYPYLLDDSIKKEFSMINLMWGLKTNYAG